MGFNPENKVTYDELAPTLQELIDSKASNNDYQKTASLVAQIYANLGTIRVSIISNTGAIANPVNDREMLLNTADHVLYGYSGGWYKCCGCYS